MQEEISFSFSRNKIIAGFVITTLLVLFWFIMLVIGLSYSSGLAIITGAFFFFIFFLAWLDQYKFLRKLLLDIPALQLTPEALIDNTNNVTFSWKDIQSFKDSSVNMGKGSRKPYIAIDLYNEADYIPLIPGLKNRIIARLNSRFFGGPFSIETNSIKESRQLVLQSLNDFKDKYTG